MDVKMFYIEVSGVNVLRRPAGGMVERFVTLPEKLSGSAVKAISISSCITFESAVYYL